MFPEMKYYCLASLMDFKIIADEHICGSISQFIIVLFALGAL